MKSERVIKIRTQNSLDSQLRTIKSKKIRIDREKYSIHIPCTSVRIPISFFSSVLLAILILKAFFEFVTTRILIPIPMAIVIVLIAILLQIHAYKIFYF